MPLIPCQDIDGQRTVKRALPPVVIWSSVVYVPRMPGSAIEHDDAWGIFEETGELVHASAYLRGADSQPVGHSRISGAALDPTIDEAPDETYVYGGPIIPHFGHFLISTLARLWPVTRSPDGPKILFHAEGTPESWFGIAYLREIFGALGLSPDRCACFPAPTRIRSLVIPRPSFQEYKFAHLVHAHLCQSAGRQLLGEAPVARSSRPAYLSKEKLTAGVRNLVNEDELTACLAKGGVEIVCPETLGFAEQLRLLASREKVVGTVGSAMHATLFLETPPRLTALCLEPYVESTYLLADAISDTRAAYLYPTGLSRAPTAPRFMASYRLRDPATTAEEILRTLG